MRACITRYLIYMLFICIYVYLHTYRIRVHNIMQKHIVYRMVGFRVNDKLSRYEREPFYARPSSSFHIYLYIYYDDVENHRLQQHPHIIFFMYKY